MTSTCHRANIAILDEEEPLPLEIRSLIGAYPNQIVNYDGAFIHLANGDSVLFKLNQEFTHKDRLSAPDVSSMFYDRYPLGQLEIPDFLCDPGRYRNEVLFMSMYGHTADAVRKNLVNVDCFGVPIPFSTNNGAADSLRSVIREVAITAPHLRKYFDKPSSFYWRKVRGANRLSAHSSGIAVDIGVKYSNLIISQHHNHVIC